MNTGMLDMSNLHRDRIRAGLLALLLAGPLQGVTPSFAAPPTAVAAKPVTEPPQEGASRIAAVVNGDVISQADIANRARLFAISTGLPLSPEVIERLKPQILRQLIDERLRVQEAQRRKIVIQDAQIADTSRGSEPAGPPP